MLLMMKSCCVIAIISTSTMGWPRSGGVDLIHQLPKAVIIPCFDCSSLLLKTLGCCLRKLLLPLLLPRKIRFLLLPPLLFLGSILVCRFASNCWFPRLGRWRRS